MKWQDLIPSRNVEDARGGLPIAGAGLGAGGLVVVVIASLLFGVNPLTVLSLLEGGTGAPTANREAVAPPAGDRQADFVEAVLGSMEQSWTQRLGQDFQPAKLVLFDNAVRSACGTASSAIGPFYCPPDQRIYLDLGFFNELSTRFQADSDLARAYVIAHEVGHHLQNLNGTSERVQRQQRSSGKVQANALSVKLELQADCYAGVWAHDAQRQQLLEAGDLEGALTAASAIGDDNLQRRSQGTVVPESFTHGSSAQRVSWFQRGFSSGDASRCNTFG
ncbi:MAG: neutral zinc metallopeptidase [Candidatus Sericytochromatia bacterium]